MRVKSLGTAERALENGLFIQHKDDHGGDGGFERHLGNYAREMCEERMAELANKIETQGRLLSERADIGEMERYRALISELLGEVVGNAYAFRKERFIDSRGRLKICAIVTKINQKLEDLAREILEKTKDTLAIVSRIDEIRGLIIDILS